MVRLRTNPEQDKIEGFAFTPTMKGLKMRQIIWLASLSIFASIPSANGIAFPTPLPTNTQHVTAEAPQPTAGVQLKRRDFYDEYDNELPLSGLLYNPFRIGWTRTEVHGMQYS